MRSARKRRIETASERLAWLIVLATVPAAVIGAAGEGFIEDELGQPWQIAILLAVFGLLLAAADRMPQRREMDGLGWRAALGIGFAQSLALAPGVSRSGVTITAARALGLTRDAAARFSFLLLTPVVAGASIVEGADLAQGGPAARQRRPDRGRRRRGGASPASPRSGCCCATCATTATTSSSGTGSSRRLVSRPDCVGREAVDVLSSDISSLPHCQQ